ncbi:arsenate reductase (glutaredoxin) [Burkholderiaceae bacterium DAT-1]|nr:arsenate reductase (glutaredoxin) [Burkholderiaceae bacterium DAT-1]
MSITLYHNPRCSKSREACTLLNERGITYTTVHYLDTPPDAATLATLLDQLGLSDPREMMRKKEAEYAELGLDRAELTRDDLIQAMVSHPRLIERPILVKDGRAVIARPQEKVFELLD